MKATCPNNPEHKEFYIVGHVMQEWKVDERGEFLELVEDLEVTHGPHPLNIWTCAKCGAEARVE